MRSPSLPDALSTWMTNMAQRGIASKTINERIIMVYGALEYIEMVIQYDGGHERTPDVEDLITAHYGHYEQMIVDQNMNADQVNKLYESINSFLAFVANEYRIPVCYLETIREHTGKGFTRATQAHLRLIGALKAMERKQKRGVVGALLERHREMKEVDDLMRRIMG